MSIRVQLALAEHFLNWYPYATKLYIRGERGKDRAVVDALHKELFDQLCGFFDKYGLTTLRSDLTKATAQARAWREVWKCQRRFDAINTPTIQLAYLRHGNLSAAYSSAKRRLDEAVELAEGLDR